MARVLPPADEQDLGLAAYMTDAPGIGGRLRSEPEDFLVIEQGDPPAAADDGAFTAARIRLRNWETNRFAAQAAKRLGIRSGQVAFAGMKDKRAVTEQWFTFRCAPERLAGLESLQDVQVIEGPYRARKAQYAGAHTGNRFVLRVRDHHGDEAAVQAVADAIRREGGVPHHFGPQRFGAGVRPITARMGQAIVAGELEEAVRLYVGNPVPGERQDTYEARALYERSRDAEATLAALPANLDFERAILQRLARRPQEWRHALQALPGNLLQLFVHAWQSLLFNHILSERLHAGLGLRTAHLGDRVMAPDDDGSRTVLVTGENQARVQKELNRARASLTAPLIGTHTPLGDGRPGAIERQVLERFGVDASTFRCAEVPEVASRGLRRAILQPVLGLEVEWHDGDPMVSFSLGRGAYATIVMREFMKADLDAY